MSDMFKNVDLHLDDKGRLDFDAIERDCQGISMLTHDSLRVKSEVLDKYIPAMIAEIKKCQAAVRQAQFESNALFHELQIREGL